MILTKVFPSLFWDREDVTGEEDLIEYSQKIGKRLFNWLTGCEFCVIFDSNDGFFEFNTVRQYKWIGHRYQEELRYRNHDVDYNISETVKIPSLDQQLKLLEVK